MRSNHVPRRCDRAGIGFRNGPGNANDRMAVGISGVGGTNLAGRGVITRRLLRARSRRRRRSVRKRPARAAVVLTISRVCPRPIIDLTLPRRHSRHLLRHHSRRVDSSGVLSRAFVRSSTSFHVRPTIRAQLTGARIEPFQRVEVMVTMHYAGFRVPQEVWQFVGPRPP